MDRQPTCKVAARALTFADGTTAIVYGADCGPRDEADPDRSPNCPVFAPIPAGTLDGAVIYKSRCESCHLQARLAAMTPPQLVETMTHGSMMLMSDGLTHEQIQALANYIPASGRLEATAPAPPSR